MNNCKTCEGKGTLRIEGQTEIFECPCCHGAEHDCTATAEDGCAGCPKQIDG